MKAACTLEETRQVLLFVAARMIASQDVLSEADRQIGDGDHGVGMGRGFEAVQTRLLQAAPASLEDLFKTTGMALLTSIGGASGAIFGTWFRSGAKGLAGAEQLDAGGLAAFLREGLAGVQERGKAQEGDKTMVDALAPAARAAAERQSEGLEAALAAAAQAAEDGMQRTEGMLAAVGRAKTLGERALGHPDPGAISTALILRSMFQAVAQMDG